MKTTMTLIALAALAAALPATSSASPESREAASANGKFKIHVNADSGKAPPPAEEKEMVPKQPDKQEIEREAKELQERQASFAKLQAILARIKENSNPVVYEGLPHPIYNPAQLAEELKTKETVTRHGFAFYKAALPIAAEDFGKLNALIKGADSFRPYGGAKLCGGFHPDFSLVWDDQGKPIEIQFCFGCGEIKAYHNNTSAHCDMAEGIAALRPLLEKYHKHRPEPENEG